MRTNKVLFKDMKKIVIAIFILMLTTGLFSQFGKNKVQVDKINWSVIETLHFDIYYPTEAEEFGKKAALMSEQAYYYLQEAFQVPSYERIPIIFYESHREFQVTNIIYSLLVEGIGGFTESLRNRVVVPYDGSYKKLEETLIHELTHAYVNVLDNDLQASSFFNIQKMAYPFWFNEGLPEYFSVGGQDNYNNMFVLDVVFNSTIKSLEETGGYYAYRMGESFLSYIDEVYGRDKVMQLFFATKTSGNMDSASQKVFGMNFEDIQKRWRNQLLRDYTPYLATHTIPYEKYEKRTDHNQDGSNLNIAPRFTPDGNSYLYFSNRDMRTSIWRAHTIDIFEDKLILRGETKGKFEQFHFLRSNISWFPDSQHFAFVSKTESGDVIYVMDGHTKKITDSYKMYDFDAIYEIDISRDGKRIVFSGQKAMSNNIYYMDLETKEVIAITNDSYYDHQPRWSPDGTKIVFASERQQKEEAKYSHLFNKLTDQVFIYELNSDKFLQVTNDQFSNHSPMWNSVGDKIIFISEEENVANYHVIDIFEGKRAVVTRTLTGVFVGDLNYEDNMLVFPVFYENGWDIYVHRSPLENLDYYSYSSPQEVLLVDDFYEQFELYRYKFYGKNAELIKELEKNDEKKIEKRDGAFFRVRKDFTLHPQPNEINEPSIKPYRVKFLLDSLWGGVAYSSSYGAIGSIQLGFSDIMGDHSIVTQFGIAESLKNSDFVFSYLYLPRRIDYGFGVFYLNDDYILYYPKEDQYWGVKVRDLGAYVLLSYPFNRFWRIDFENMLYKHQEIDEFWNKYEDEWDYVGEGAEYVYSPELKLIQDNVLYGSTGPMSGWKGLVGVSKIFAEEEADFYRLRADLRHYQLFAKNYSFAKRLILGKTDTDIPTNQFRLDGYNGVRGSIDDRRGAYKAVTNIELRFPFVERLSMKFPLPMTITNVRGSFYTDFGAVWGDDFKDFKGVKDGLLNDFVLGFGLGPRINLGYFVLKFDTAWTTNLSTASEPVFYLSISEEF